MRYWLFILIFWLASVAQAAALEQAAVVAARPEAATAGAAMLKAGGNAFDAAAATALALGVVEPASSGFGGGGFFLLYIAKENRFVMLDARETSPKLAGHGEIYTQQSSMDGPQAAGVPGLPAAVAALATRYGKLGLKRIAAPAIRLARQGFRVSPRLARLIAWRKSVFNATAKRLFDKKSGDIITQPQLAHTLERFAERGVRDVYEGEIAGRLVADLKRDGGLIREDDLAAYRLMERQPITFDYHGFHIVSASLPSSGGMTLAHILGQLKHDDLAALSAVDRVHLLVEAMKRAYRDRNSYLGDPDFVHIPEDYLDPKRLARLRAFIRMDRATPAVELRGMLEPSGEAANTSHFSIIDHQGNMVSATLSINYPFGSGYVSPSTGILLNDEMDDFATRPGKPNAYGLIQGKANEVAPGKRMLSSMTPTIILGPKRTFIVGTPGGSRIISMVLLAGLGFMLNETSPEQWVNAPRFHHQYLPDVIQHEPGTFSPDMARELAKRGHVLKALARPYGNMQAILIDRKAGKVIGLSDKRGEGTAVLIPSGQ